MKPTTDKFKTNKHAKQMEHIQQVVTVEVIVEQIKSAQGSLFQHGCAA